MTHLMTNPHCWAAIAKDPGLIERRRRSAAARPAGQLLSPQGHRRCRDRGDDHPAGSIVYVAITAANRDPQRWDDPDTFRLDRPSKTTLSFFAVPHTCIGMHLGRREMTILIEELAARFPRMALDADQPAPVIEGWMLRGASHLPVVADTSTTARQ